MPLRPCCCYLCCWQVLLRVLLACHGTAHSLLALGGHGCPPSAGVEPREPRNPSAGRPFAGGSAGGADAHPLPLLPPSLPPCLAARAATFDYPTPAALARFIAAQVVPGGGLPALAEDWGAGPEAPPPAAGAAGASGTSAGGQAPARPAQPAAATASGSAAVEATLAEVANVVAGILGAEVAPDQPMMEAGLDSLGAVQVRVWVRVQVQVRVRVRVQARVRARVQVRVPPVLCVVQCHE